MILKPEELLSGQSQTMKYKYFAIDFDGTIYNKVTKEILQDAARVIQRIKDNQGEIAIWTCRTHEDEEEALRILHENNIPYDVFNDTLPSVKSSWGDNGRKIWAEIYIDDMSIHCRNGVNWSEIEEWIFGK